MYHFTRFLTALYLALTLCATIGQTISSRKFTLGSQFPPAFKAPSPNVPAAHVLTLNVAPGASRSARYIQSLHDRQHINRVYGLTPMNYVAADNMLVAYLEIGTQSFQAQIDTGSSDTWVVGKDFQCVDETTRAPDPESACMFGPTYTIEPTFRRIKNETFHIFYADGTTVTGIYGNDTVTLAGIAVQNQQIAVADHASKFYGNDVTSGYIGLAFPSATSAYAGSDPSNTTEPITYNPILTNLFSKGYVAPVFSLAIERSSITSGVAAGGLLAIGGLPPVRHSPVFSSAPFLLITVDPYGNPYSVPQYHFYTIIVRGFKYEGSTETNWTRPTNFPNPLPLPTDPSHHSVMIDSGSTLIYLPTGIADAVNALFDPPAVYDAGYGAYLVDCAAKAPEFGAEIGDQTFFIKGEDMKIPVPGTDEICASGISDAGSSMSVLGTVFLRNVLAVFDVGASEMRFAAREY